MARALTLAFVPAVAPPVIVPLRLPPARTMKPSLVPLGPVKFANPAKVIGRADESLWKMIAPELFPLSKDFTRPKVDPDGAKKLLTEAGYPDGFELTMDCPNDRYVNDDGPAALVIREHLMPVEGPDGNLYVVTDGDGGGGGIWKVVPV